MMAISGYIDYKNARDTSLAAIGRRGVKKIESLDDDAKKVDIDSVARSYKRKGVTVKSAVAAARIWHEAHHVDWPKYRSSVRQIKRRRIIQSGANLGVKKMPKRRDTLQLIDALEKSRQRQITDFFDVFAHGSISVVWSRDADVTVSYKDDFDGYSRQTKYAMRIWTVTVHAQKMMVSDMPGNRRVIDGLCTLSAAGIQSPDGQTRAWSAQWAQKSTGVSWTVKSGVIVESLDGEIVHGRTLKIAMATLRRRRTNDQNDALVRCGLKMTRDQILSDYGDVRLNWRIARRAGLCADGIRSWANDNFPGREPESDTVTVAEALATRSSETLVLRAIAYAIARNTKHVA